MSTPLTNRNEYAHDSFIADKKQIYSNENLPLMNHQSISGSKSIVLTTPHGLPFSFTITISAAEAPDPGLDFEVSGKDSTGSDRTCFYRVPDREHHSYLDFFGKLSEDFGLRLPRNREKGTEKPFPNITLKEVLTKNLGSEILYGYGDPAVIRVEKGSEVLYYLLATSNDAPQSFPILRSRNLEEWELVDFVFREGKKPKWASEGMFVSDYWAAEMHQVADEFRIYFVARDKVSTELCIGVAKSAQPEGPFLADDEPILRGNIIDPHVFVQSADTTYLYWKEDNNDVWPGKLLELLINNPHLTTTLFDQREDQATAAFTQALWPWLQTLHPMERFLAMQVFIEVVISGFAQYYDQLTKLLNTKPDYLHEQINTVLKYMKTPMYAQRLSEDGSSLTGERTKILENDLQWEAHLVEGMWLTRHQDKYYLFYAGNDFSTAQYGIGVAIGDSPLGPFSKMDGPFLRSTSKWWAPGHPSVVTDLSGGQQMFFHAFYPGKAGYKEFRALLSAPLIFGENEVRLGRFEANL